MRPASFDLQQPPTVTAALSLLADDSSRKVRIMAGGQALLKTLRERAEQPQCIVDISGLHELDYVRRADDAVDIGALVTLASLAANPVIAADLPALHEAALSVGDVQIRNRATLGGNVLSGWSSDLAVVLLALDATGTLRTQQQSRTLTIAEVVRDGCAADELLMSLRIPCRASCAFTKLARRSADPALANAAIAVTPDHARYHVAVGGVHSHPLRLPQVETALAQPTTSLATIEKICRIEADKLSPPPNPHGSADYRRRVLPTLVLRTLQRTRALAGLGVLT
jgi:CO/xanthine dehydrogenase FAD-binding subunit